MVKQRTEADLPEDDTDTRRSGSSDSLTRRENYLLETLGLSHDPFATPVAEQELLHWGQANYFFSYYTDPLPNEEQPLRDALRESRSAFIFGEPGSGKTTLRYILEADCRALSLGPIKRPLVVTYELSHDFPRPLTPDEHWQQLAEELAVDLFIQIIEQFNALGDPPTEDQCDAWRGQIAHAQGRLERMIPDILQGAETEARLDSLWSRLGRSAISPIESSQPLRDLLRKCLLANSQAATPPQTGEALLRAGLQAAQVWNFRRVFVLIDGVDARRRDLAFMYALIEPLLKSLTTWQDEAVYFKFFLPLELRSAVTDQLGGVSDNWSSPMIQTLLWKESTLRQLLANRFRAAGSYRVGFDELAEAGRQGQPDWRLIEKADGFPRQLLQWVNRLVQTIRWIESTLSQLLTNRFRAEAELQLDRMLIEKAGGSPRRLLQWLNKLIDAHAARDPRRLWIGLEDWNSLV